jgi:mRNA-degrading endonuclease YafQ of YafQ-DinJ toxin-antitoxin module
MAKRLTARYTPTFFRKLKKMESALQEEVLEKIELFNDPKNHRMLKMHKLQGRLKGLYSLSVNYRVRIVFEYIENGRTALFLTVGEHEIYN